jgi:Fe-S-cluster containining protein
MDIEGRIELLKLIYRQCDELMVGYQLYCRRQCALCCTRNVTISTLEALFLIRSWEVAGSELWIAAVHQAVAEPRLLPVTTLNQFAELCARDAPIPKGGDYLETQGCPFLDDDLCTIYDSRPFGCRAMVSRTYCGDHQQADMPEFVLTANNVLMQYIEALDVNRFSGNMFDVLLMMSSPLQRRSYEGDLPMHPTASLLVNRPISVLMVPPEHQQRIQPLLQALLKAQQQVA